MHDSSLSTLTADYPQIFDIADPQVVMPITSNKTQVIHEFDNGGISVISISDDSYFDVELQWEYLSQTDMELMIDWWNDPAKANGIENTFYWKHPVTDSLGTYHYYTVRFMSQMRNVHRPHFLFGVDTIQLRIEGLKP